MIVIGLTGGVGTGKSTVARFFHELGAYVIDWDELAREVVRPGSKAWKEIVDVFGKDILNADLSLNRQKLANIVFTDKEKLRKLNQIVHPEVFREDQRITEEINKRDPNAIIVKDIPLLIESGLPIVVDKMIVVWASEETQLRRLEEKGMSLEDAKNRMRSQLPLKEKIRYADFIIDNNGSLEETKKQVEQIYASLRTGKLLGN